MKLLVELKRRNVMRMAGLYVVGAWLAIQVAETMLPIFGTPAWVLKAVVMLIAIGFVPALVLAWVFELTPQGLKRESSVGGSGDGSRAYLGPDRRELGMRAAPGANVAADQTQDQAAPSSEVQSAQNRRIDRVIIVALLLALGMFSLDKFVLSKSRATQAATIATKAMNNLVAVLPFQNRSVKKEDEYFVEGIHDDLLTQLSKVAYFKVISRTSMMAFADTRLSVPEIARQLGAGLVLEGAVQRAGDKVRVTVQLIDGATDVHLWAEKYDRVLTTETIFGIQADIAIAVANAMQVVLSPAETGALAAGSTNSLPAYEAFIQGKLLAAHDLASAERFTEALGLFDRAIELDPDFADAYAHKARTQLAMYWFGYGDASLRKAARISVAQAKRLAPDSIETGMAEAYLSYWGRRDYASAEALLAGVLEHAPEYADAWYARALVARRDGRFQDCVDYFRRALTIDPANANTILELSNTLEGLGRLDEVDALYAKSAAWAKAPVFDRPENLMARGDIEGAWRALDGPNEFYPSLPLKIAVASRDPERITKALSLALWPEELRHSPDYPEIYALSQAEGLLVSGRTDEARIALDAIGARLDSADIPYPGAWAGSGSYYYFPCDLPGMRGDLAGVRDAERDFFENAPKDAWSEFNVRIALAAAFNRASDPERALVHLEWVIETFGPNVFPGFAASPGLLGLQNHPRYLAMQTAYQKSMAARKTLEKGDKA